MTAKKSTKTSTKKTATAEAKEVENVKVNELIDLSEALVREVDNLMTSKLPPAQVGKVLGDIMSGFSEQVNTYK